MSNIVRDRLIADGTVAGLVSTRVYFIQLQQDCALPAISTSIISEEVQNGVGGEASLRNVHWSVDCYSQSVSEADTLADAVEAAMAPNGVDFSAVKTDRNNLYENETKLHRISIDYSLWI